MIETKEWLRLIGLKHCLKVHQQKSHYLAFNHVWGAALPPHLSHAESSGPEALS